MLVEVGGVQRRLSVGDRCEISARGDRKLNCEVVGFRDGRALLMPFGALEGVGLGCKADVIDAAPVVRPTRAWLGRVINAMGEPIDGKGPLPEGDVIYPLKNAPPPAHARQRVSGKVDLGVRAINTFLSCCRGQRMGIFAGSGVGKSVLLGMIARYTAADVSVIGLIGERGRYPAINLLRSLSRAMPGCNNEDENKLVGRARELLSAYEDMAEMIRLGAYRPGSDPKTDEAIRYYPALDGFLKQSRNQRADLAGGYAELAAILQDSAA
jgi:flagellar biosynthesis/type III secretory pathway ATPase